METDYDPNNLGNITWGYIQPASRSFMLNYCDECYVVIPNYSIPGFDSAKFVAALKEIDPNADFDPPEPSPVPPTPTPDTWKPFHADRFEHKDWYKYNDGSGEFMWQTAGKYY